MRNGAVLEINLNQLGINLNCINEAFPTNKVLLMVKADAYGHGIIPITKYAYENNGIKSFGCATLAEAIYIRNSLEGNFELFVFSETNLKDASSKSMYLDFNIIPVISNIEDFFLITDDLDYKYLPIVLKFNTGMNRLGLEVNELPVIIKQLQKHNRDIEHLMSHFACSNLSLENSSNSRQIKLFNEIKKSLNENNIKFNNSSISNSGAIEQNYGHDDTFIRPGLLAYGQQSVMKNNLLKINWDGDLISSLKAKVLQIRSVVKGTPIGYGANPVPNTGTIYITAIGYGDGFSCSFQSTDFTYGEKIGKLVGRINMDMCQVLFTEKLNLNKGDWLEFWGKDNSNFESFCKKAKKIPYEVFCNLSPRLPRVYIKC